MRWWRFLAPLLLQSQRHSQQFSNYTVSNLGLEQSAIWHLHCQQFGIYTVSSLGQHWAFTESVIWQTYMALQQHSDEKTTLLS